MDKIDASAHSLLSTQDDLPSLLTVIIDTNPHAWSALHSTLPFPTALSHLLLFLNTHLTFSNSNRVCVLASHPLAARILYPRATPSALPPSPQDANKFRPFRQLEEDVQQSLRELFAAYPVEQQPISAYNETAMSGALSLALGYINKQVRADPGVGISANTQAQQQQSGAAAADGGGAARMTARILVVSVSGDIAHQYVSVMNSIFAAQRQKVPIDIAKVAGDTVFLQQASEATGGVYLAIEHPSSLMQYLLTSFMPDPSTRRHLIPPSHLNVDFRAACFCHKRVVDIGFVCSICLSSQSSHPQYHLGARAFAPSAWAPPPLPLPPCYAPRLPDARPLPRFSRLPGAPPLFRLADHRKVIPTTGRSLRFARSKKREALTDHSSCEFENEEVGETEHDVAMGTKVAMVFWMQRGDSSHSPSNYKALFRGYDKWRREDESASPELLAEWFVRHDAAISEVLEMHERVIRYEARHGHSAAEWEPADESDRSSFSWA